MEKCGVCVRFVWSSGVNSTRFKPSVDKGLRRFVWNVGLFLKKGAKLFRDSPRKRGDCPVLR